MRKSVKLAGLILTAVLLTLTLAAVQVSAAGTESSDATDKKETGRYDALLPDHDKLIEQYLTKSARQQLKKKSTSSATPKFSKRPGRDKLSKREKLVYDYLKTEIEKVAIGKRSSTAFAIPASVFLEGKRAYTFDELGFEYTGGMFTDEQIEIVYNHIGIDAERILNALMIDIPYEFYWYDKTEITSWTPFGYPGDYYVSSEDIFIPEDKNFEIILPVSKDYSLNGGIGETNANTQLTAATSQAAVNAGLVINHAFYFSDYDKLHTYADTICSFVDYNWDAASYDTPYGDPWQLIWVFDDNPDTKVVCEGYAKAFKYLCDLSSFSSPLIEAYIVTGSAGGPHMWNLVRMQDGLMYHMDVTFSDNDDAYMSDRPDSNVNTNSVDDFFLKGDPEQNPKYYTITVDHGMYRQYCQYIYDSATLSMYSDEERTLAPHDYEIGTPSNSEMEEERLNEDEDEAAYEEASPVIYAINEISSWLDVSLADESIINAVRNEYNALSPAAKAKVPAEVLKALEKAEARIEELKYEEAHKNDNTSDDSGSGSGNGNGNDSGSGNGSGNGNGSGSGNGSGNGNGSGSGNGSGNGNGSGSDNGSGSGSDDTPSWDDPFDWNYIPVIDDTDYYTPKIKIGKIRKLKAKGAKKSIKLKWKKVKGRVKYQVKYKPLKGGKWKKKTAKKNKLTLKKLKSGKKYIVRVRAFRKVNGIRYYGSWCKAKKVKVK